MALSPAKARQRFYELLWPLRGDVLRVARMLVRSDADAEDLAQETLMKAFAAIESFEVGTDARAWLFRILRNARVDRVRSMARESGQVSLDAAELDVPAREESGSDSWQEPHEILNQFSDAQVIDALQELPEEIRLTLLLVDVQQMDHSEAAGILEVPVGTIKSRTHRGRAMLREALQSLAQELRLRK